MQDATLGGGKLKQLAADFEGLLRELPEERRAMYEEIGEALLGRVRSNIGGSGRVAGWQGAFVGSRGGYVAIRPKAKTYDGSGGKRRYAVGYVTNAIENGHRQQKGRYIPALGRRAVQERVTGKGFYAETRRESEEIAYEAAERFVQRLKERLEG